MRLGIRGQQLQLPHLQLILLFHLLSGSPVAEGLLAARTPASFVLNKLYEATEIRL
jgi:hypothetical protein